MRVSSVVVVAVAVVAAACPAGAAVTEVASFGDNPGNLKMFVHAPAAGGALPLVVALHGCTQDKDFADDAGLTALADDAGFIVVTPEQQGANNLQSCFNWFLADDITRGSGEVQSILNMVAQAKADHDVDADRVFVTGVSAGAAMGAVLLAVAPDVFAGGALFAGVPYGCAETLAEGFACMSSGDPSLDQAGWAAVVDAVAPAGSAPPRVAIWHGTSDTTVNIANADQLVLQWTGAHGLSSTPTSEETTGAVTRRRFGTAVEQIRVSGMDHAVPNDPGAGCGAAAAFFDDAPGVCGAREAAVFFGLVDDVGEGEGEEGEGEEGEGEEGEGEGEGEEGGCAAVPVDVVAGAAAFALLAWRRRR